MNTIYSKMIGKRRKNFHDFIHVFKGHGCAELNFNVSVSHSTQDMVEVDVMKSPLKKPTTKVNEEGITTKTVGKPIGKKSR